MTNIKDNRLIDGIVVKKRIIAEIKQYAENFTKMPCLVSILIGDVPEAAVYVRNQARGAEQAGMPFMQVIIVVFFPIRGFIFSRLGRSAGDFIVKKR